MDNVFEFIKSVWPAVATIGNLVFIAAFAWMKSQFVTKTDHEALKIDVASQDKRLVKVEADDKHEPSRAELGRMNSELSARLRGLEAAVEAGQKATNDQLKTLNNYLHTLVENEIRGAKK